MHPAQIKAAIEEAGWTARKIARRRRIQPSGVSSVIHGKATSLPTARFISRITGKPISELWPGKYADASKTLAV